MTTAQQIANLELQISPLASRLQKLREQKRDEDSIEFVRANQITLADVELSSGDGKPYFGIINSFIDWLKTHPQKRFAEWNTCLYFTSDLLNNRMPQTPGLLEHVTK